MLFLEGLSLNSSQVSQKFGRVTGPHLTGRNIWPIWDYRACSYEGSWCDCGSSTNVTSNTDEGSITNCARVQRGVYGFIKEILAQIVTLFPILVAPRSALILTLSMTTDLLPMTTGFFSPLIMVPNQAEDWVKKLAYAGFELHISENSSVWSNKLDSIELRSLAVDLNSSKGCDDCIIIKSTSIIVVRWSLNLESFSQEVSAPSLVHWTSDAHCHLVQEVVDDWSEHAC